MKLKWLSNFLPLATQKLEYLEKENKSIPNPYKMARDAYESQVTMLEKNKEEEEEMKKKK